MPVLETILIALSSLSVPAAIGMHAGSPKASHIVVVPDYESEFEADNDALYVDEHANLEIYVSGDHRPLVASVKAAIKAAGLVVGQGQYVEYDATNETHHYTLPVTGRNF